MTGVQQRLQAAQKALLFGLVALALVVVWGAVAQARDLTVTTRVDVPDIARESEIWLVRIVSDPDDAESVVTGLRWVKDTSSWFPTWVLELVSAHGVLPTHLPAQSKGNLRTVQAAKVAPTAGHTYEAVLSYSGDLGIVAIKLLDTTDGRVLYADGYELAGYDGEMYALSGSAIAHYLPVGATWTVGSMRGTFIPLSQFDQGSEEQTAIRLVSPTSTPGEFRFTLITAGSEDVIDALTPIARETLIPLPLAQLPVGVSHVRMDYVVDDVVLLSEDKPLTLGRVDFRMRPVVMERERGVVSALFDISTPEALADDLSVSVYARLYELVWNPKERAFDSVTVFEDVLVYQGDIDLTSGAAQLTTELPLPDRPGNWRVQLLPEVSPQLRVTLTGEERLFSTHLPAKVAEGEEYTIVVFPDTQHFAHAYTDIFTRMTDWVTANAHSMNFAALLHVGDITNNNTTTQWENAFASMSVLNDVVPYVISIGNHDMVGPGGVDRRGDTLVNNYFPVEHARRYGNLVDTLVPGRVENHYALFSIGGTDYLVLSLEYGPPDEAVEWASEVARQYPEHKVILLTHSYLSGNGRRSTNVRNTLLGQNPDTTVNTAVGMWERVLRLNPNSFMVIGGHSAPSAPTVPYQVQRNAAGRPVFEFVFDWQDEPNGGNGWLGLITFKPDDTMEVRVYSPYLDEWADATDNNGYKSRVTLDLNTGQTLR